MEHDQHQRVPHQGSGVHAVQELAFTIADGIAYVQAGIDAGIRWTSSPHGCRTSSTPTWIFSRRSRIPGRAPDVGTHHAGAFHAKDENSWKLRFHTQTAGCTLTAQQPMNNVVRVALQAALGSPRGTQSLHTNSMDETLALPTEQAVTVALRTQQIIAEESGVANAIDPLGGSFFVEQLTSGMEEKAMEYIRKIDEMGGMVAAIKTGYPQREVADAAFHFQRLLDAGRSGSSASTRTGRRRSPDPTAEDRRSGREAGR